jgi:hypothetical protein
VKVEAKVEAKRAKKRAKDAKEVERAEKEAKKEERKEERAEKEAKKEERKGERKRVKDAKEVERAEKGKAALEFTKSQGKSTGVSWNKNHCKWLATFHQRGMTRRHLGCFDDHAEVVAAYSSYSSSQ